MFFLLDFCLEMIIIFLVSDISVIARLMIFHLSDMNIFLV